MYTSTQTLSGVGEMGRSAGQTTFDTERERLWKQFLSRDGFYQAAANGDSIEAVQQSITEIKQIMDAHTALYNSLRGQVDDSWLAPRYNDFQTVYEGRLQNEMQALSRLSQAAPTSSGGLSVTGAPTIVLPTDVSQPTQLVISGQGPATASATAPGSAAPVTGGGGYGTMDIFGPDSGQAAPGGQGGAGFGNLLPWLAGGVALALLLRKR
jgi:hypothetical protein